MTATIDGHTKAAPVELTRAVRRALFCSLVIVAGFGLAGSLVTVSPLFSGNTSAISIDLNAYLAFTRQWMATGQWYDPRQLAGPYVVEQITGNVYPPTLLYLTVPFTVLPPVLWYAIPAAIGTAAMIRLRPAAWTWRIALLILCYPRTWQIVFLGNPAIWVFAFLLAGLAWGWPSVFAAIKLTFAPLALVGLRRNPRAWLVTLAVCVALAIPFGSLWLDYLAVLHNTQSIRGLSYVLGEWPIAIGLLVMGLSRGAAPAGYGSVLSRLRLSAQGWG